MKQILMIFLALTFMGCSANPGLPKPEALPAGTNFGGVWYSSQFEHMYLRQTGDDVRGIYAYKNGGTLEGVANGNLLNFTWIDPGDKESATRSIIGKGYLQLVKEGDKVVLRGEWGYGESMQGGGPWEAEWVRDMDPEDPRSLEELRDRGVQ